MAKFVLTQEAKGIALGKSTSGENNKKEISHTAFIEGVRKYVTDVRDLNIDLIERINPFGEAYSILSKAMSEESLMQIHSIISSKRISMSIEDARDLAKRALKFKEERGRTPSMTSQDPWERQMAEGVSFLQRKVADGSNA